MGDHKRFRQAVIPSELAKEVVAMIQAHPEMGYRTLSEFVRAATVDRLRLSHLHLALRSMWLTSDLGADAMDALIRDSLPPEYLAIIDSRRSRLPPAYLRSSDPDQNPRKDP